MLVLQMSLARFPLAPALPYFSPPWVQGSSRPGPRAKPLGFQLGTKKVTQRQQQSETFDKVKNQIHLSWACSPDPGIATFPQSLGILIWKREARYQLHMGCVGSEGLWGGDRTKAPARGANGSFRRAEPLAGWGGGWGALSA